MGHRFSTAPLTSKIADLLIWDAHASCCPPQGCSYLEHAAHSPSSRPRRCWGVGPRVSSLDSAGIGGGGVVWHQAALQQTSPQSCKLQPRGLQRGAGEQGRQISVELD
ncbi:hypothetical protein NN561_006282 [Cricetulus griseus]